MLGRDQYRKDPCMSAKEFEFNILSEDSGQIRLHFREMALVVVWRIEGRKTGTSVAVIFMSNNEYLK